MGEAGGLGGQVVQVVSGVRWSRARSGGPGLGQVALGVSVVPGARGSHWGSRWSRGLGGRTGGLGGPGGSWGSRWSRGLGGRTGGLGGHGGSVVLGGMNDKKPEP